MSGIHPALTNHYEGMNDVLHERDRLSALACDLQNELVVAKDKIEWLGKQLAVTISERDHYMRYSFALTTRVNAMQDIWAGMMELSKQEANSQLPKAPQLQSLAENQEERE